MSQSFAELVEEGNVTSTEEEEMETVGWKGGTRESEPIRSVYDGLHEIQNRTFPRKTMDERYPFSIVWTPLPGLT